MPDPTPPKTGPVHSDARSKVLVLFGTRPETIKLAPVIHELRDRGFLTTVVCSSQHKKLLEPFLATLNVQVDHDLRVMKRNQNPNGVCAKVMSGLDQIIEKERPDVIMVQGDTTTTLAGAMAGFNRKIPVAHVEAGLRSGDLMSPFPEEMNRRLVSQISTIHFAATENNRRNLLAEHVPGERIFITGNTVVDSLQKILTDHRPSQWITDLIEKTESKKRLLLTTHRRESFGKKLTENLHVLRDFSLAHEDVCIFFPVHPNPNVKRLANEILGQQKGIHLLSPMDYPDFLALMRSAWLIVSDSGGVQEEAPSLGKPLLILRDNTERPEAVTAGVARLVGNGSLRQILEQNYAIDTWTESVQQIANPFGDGRSAERIVTILARAFSLRSASASIPRSARSIRGPVIRSDHHVFPSRTCKSEISSR
jgi:UDP-N-acetylglucosamine 2-epimerase (non-hydrolysing)